MTGRSDRPEVSVLTSGHDVADARLHREVAALHRAGLTVEVLGLGDEASAPAGVSVRTWARGGMVTRGVRALRLPFQAQGGVFLVLDPDVVPAALLAGRLRRRRVVADVHEDYVALLNDRAWATRGRGLLQRLARWCVGLSGRASLTVVADDHVPPQQERCRQRFVVRNLPDAATLPVPAPIPAHPPLRAVYVGDVRASRGLRTMIDAVAQAPGWELDIIGPVAPGEADWLAARLLADGLADDEETARIHLHGRMPPAQAWTIATGASVGMLLVEETPAFRDAVPTKLYEYLASGMALLATPLPRVAPFVTDTGAGALVDSADAAARQLRDWANDPVALATARQAALGWAAENLVGVSPWDELAAKVAVLARGKGSPPATPAPRPDTEQAPSGDPGLRPRDRGTRGRRARTTPTARA